VDHRGVQTAAAADTFLGRYCKPRRPAILDKPWPKPTLGVRLRTMQMMKAVKQKMLARQKHACSAYVEFAAFLPRIQKLNLYES
jgi:hypothetical protein